MIHEGTQPQDKNQTNWNKELRKLDGYLDDKVAIQSYVQFLKYNLKILVKLMIGFYMEPYQVLMIKGWLKKNFTLCVAPRGSAKSTLAGIFSIIYCLLNPDKHVIIVSTNFRSSRSILEKIEIWAKRKKGLFLAQCIDTPSKGGLVYKRPDMFRVTFKNGSSIKALPLGDANNLRGQRCNVLIIDEGLLIPQQTIDYVLKPFLFASGDIEESQAIISEENEKIARGLMTEEQRTKQKPKAKMIVMSSASYRWEHLYTIYESYLKKVFGQEKEEDKKNQSEQEKEASYLVQQFSYLIVPPHILDKGMLDDLKNGTVPQTVIDREYHSKFTQDSDGYFKAAMMEACTIKNGLEPCVELRGERGAEYVLAIDPAVGSGDANDHFAMCLLKIINKPNSDKKIGMVVHQYAVAGAALEYHYLYLAYILKHFNVVYIACDTTQGDMADFISSANQSGLFKEKHIELNAIEADFTKDSEEEIKKQIKASYNKTGGVIVQKQYFSGAYIKASNEWLQACINFKNIYFAGKALACDRAREQLTHQQVDRIYEIHPEWATNQKDKEGNDTTDIKGSIYSFIESQDDWMDLVKKECALIEEHRNQFSVSFDLPPAMTRNRKSPNRVRRDSYTALCLGNWALKLYVEAMTLEAETFFEIPPPSLV